MRQTHFSTTGLALFACVVAAPIANEAQTTATTRLVCPLKSPLKLDQIVGEIANKVPDDRITGLVSACHEDFRLDPPALERLAAVGASLNIVDTLSTDTISRMTLAQARDEIAALERRMRENEAASGAARDAALAKLDAEYQSSPQKAKKGEFETTADYKARIDAADAAHANDRARVVAEFSNELAGKNQLLERRISALKAGLYPVSGPAPAYVAYDADLSRLTAALNGQEFYFVARPEQAKALHDQWSAVKAFERYDDDEMHTRYLAEAPNLNPVTGIPRAIVDENERKKAEADAAQKKAQDDALAAQQKAAEEARAAAEAVRQQRLAAQQKLQDAKALFARNPKAFPGTWGDAATGLVWLEQDNGKNVNWQEAKDYCEQISIAGTAGWRLATIAELNSIFDRSHPTRKVNVGGTLLGRGGVQYSFYYIRGGIHLSEMISWSSTPGQDGFGVMLVKRFDNGNSVPVGVSTKNGRVVCAGSIQ